ncbi:MAG TPA: EamA family transporter [Stellaceae bacterium]|jgi:drug/metabolite transporter (DMT)-like permease
MPIVAYYAALVAGIVLGVVGQIALKAGAEASTRHTASDIGAIDGILAQMLNPFTIGGFAVYVLAAFCYIVAIKKIPLSLAFPSVSISYAIVAILAALLWGEPFGVRQVAGIALIGGGILMLYS